MVKLKCIIAWILQKNKAQFCGSQAAVYLWNLTFVRASTISPLLFFFFLFRIGIYILYKFWDLSKNKYFVLFVVHIIWLKTPFYFLKMCLKGSTSPVPQNLSLHPWVVITRNVIEGYLKKYIWGYIINSINGICGQSSDIECHYIKIKLNENIAL